MSAPPAEGAASAPPSRSLDWCGIARTIQANPSVALEAPILGWILTGELSLADVTEKLAGDAPQRKAFLAGQIAAGHLARSVIALDKRERALRAALELSRRQTDEAHAEFIELDHLKTRVVAERAALDARIAECDRALKSGRPDPGLPTVDALGGHHHHQAPMESAGLNARVLRGYGGRKKVMSRRRASSSFDEHGRRLSAELEDELSPWESTPRHSPRSGPMSYSTGMGGSSSSAVGSTAARLSSMMLGVPESPRSLQSRASRASTDASAPDDVDAVLLGTLRSEVGLVGQ